MDDVEITLIFKFPAKRLNEIRDEWQQTYEENHDEIVHEWHQRNQHREEACQIHAELDTSWDTLFANLSQETTDAFMQHIWKLIREEIGSEPEEALNGWLEELLVNKLIKLPVYKRPDDDVELISNCKPLHSLGGDDET